MSASWDNFERYKQKGLDARRAGQWDAARVYLLEAARSMVSLGKSAASEELKSARAEMASKLLDLAKDCDSARKENRKSGVIQQSARAEAEGGSKSSSWLMTERPKIKFDDVAGLDDVKEEIRLKMLYPMEHPELARRFGIEGGGGVLLYGPPGTGKTMLARATAGEIDAAFYRVSPADILSKWVGEAEQNIKKLFDLARAQPRSIIFIDEIEALVPARRDEGSSVMQRVVPQILQELEGVDKKVPDPLMSTDKKGSGTITSSLLFMGATNTPWQLDPAVLRPGRFDEKIYIPLPDLLARRKMLDLYLTHRPLADDVDLEALAADLEGYSGADIKYLCDRAAVVPFLQSVSGQTDQEITDEILRDVLQSTPRSVTAEQLQRFDAWI